MSDPTFKVSAGQKEILDLPPELGPPCPEPRVVRQGTLSSRKWPMPGNFGKTWAPPYPDSPAFRYPKATYVARCVASGFDSG